MRSLNSGIASCYAATAGSNLPVPDTDTSPLTSPARPLYRKPANLTRDQLITAQRRVEKGETISHVAQTLRVSYGSLWRGLTWLKNLPAGAVD